VPVVVVGVVGALEGIGVGMLKNADVVGNVSGIVNLRISKVECVNLHGHLRHIIRVRRIVFLRSAKR